MDIQHYEILQCLYKVNIALTIAGTYSTQNALGHLSASTFPFSKMIHLRLSYCGIDSLQDGTFTSLTELKSLSLDFNKIPALTQKNKTFL
jgi:hypothetical protein